MEFGASIFFTDYSITPTELAAAMEERGFDSVWAAEHSHIPVPRRTRADSELGKRYYDVMDPFVTLTAAACATKRLKIATGICLVIQRDTIQTAKGLSGNKRAIWGISLWRDSVVPLAAEFGAFDIDCGHLGIRDDNAAGVLASVEFAAHSEAGFGGGGRD